MILHADYTEEKTMPKNYPNCFDYKEYSSYSSA